MTVFELVAFLKLNKDSYEKGLDEAKGEASSFGGAVASGFGTLAKAGTAALGAVSAATVSFGKQSVETGMEFDKAMSQVAATMGMTMEQANKETGKVTTAFGEFQGNLSEYAQFMGANTAFSATQAAEALNYMALAGYDVQTSMEMLPNVLSLAAAGNMDLARASDMVTDTATAFGLILEDGTVDMQRTSLLIDEMAKAASTGNTSVEQMGDAFLVIGGLTKELNGGMLTLEDGTTAYADGVQELEIALTAMANAGIKGSEAGTHMRNMLLKLSAPTEDGATALQNLGVAVFDAQGRMRSLNDIFSDMKNAMNGDVLPSFEKFYQSMSQLDDKKLLKKFQEKPEELEFFGVSIVDTEGKLKDFETAYKEAQQTFGKGLSQQSKLTAISDMFNTRDVASAEALLAAVENDWNKIGDAVLHAWYNEDEFNEQLANLGLSTEKIQANFLSLGVSAEDFNAILLESGGSAEDFLFSLNEAVASGVDMDDILRALGTDSDGLQKMFDSMTGSAQQMANTQLDNLAGDITLFKSALEGAKIAVSNGVTPALRDFVKLGTEGMTKITKALNEGDFDAVVEALEEVLTEGIDMIIEKLPEVLETGAKILTSLIDGINENMPEVSEAALQIITILIEFLANNMPKIIEMGVQLIISLANGLAQQAPTLVPVILDALMLIVQTLLSNAPEMLKAASQLIVALANGLVDYIPTLVDNLPEIISAIVEGLIALAGELAGSALEIILALAEGLIKAVPELVLRLPEIILAICDGLVDGIGDLADVGRRLVEGLWEGIKDAGSWLKDKITGWGEDIYDGITDFFGISSPSKLFAEIGGYLVAGLGKGWDDNIGDVIDDMTDDMDFESNVSVTSDTKKVDDEAVGDDDLGTERSTTGRDIIIPVYIGQTKLDEVIVTNEQLRNYRSGGR